MDFEQAYNLIRRYDSPDFSLVTKDRCKEIWDTVGEVLDAGVPGNLVEVGVWRGGTGALIAAQMNNRGSKRKLFLCDTFSGVVKAGSEDESFYRGGEHTDCSEATVMKLIEEYFRLSIDYVILKGVFPDETLSKIAAPVSFVHLDVDVYRSTKESFESLLPLISSGGRMIIDDYGWPRCPGVTKFVDDLILENERVDDLIEKRNEFEVGLGSAKFLAIVKKC
jgi:O-methyltransferase